MRLRNLLIIFAITFTGLGFSACTDESEEIIPQPLNGSEGQATTGSGGENSQGN
ncbi:hypothetical protein LVD17_13800 [Fulvivirga ulvae]|uniref:hypothetical protein n=1 Tax=Fulvivirga ulvae TaxID=2904245 RepID=UPI001F3EAAAB|nr:hypothetical protein [Fulvivirga ulvae]UII34881.1 hypothetical protein LVD17_13800 [Fulvivirga ulvae]